MVTINVNGLSMCHKGSDGVIVAAPPDVCWTPPVPIPIPYPNTAFSADLANGTSSVAADGGNSIAIFGSIFAVSYLDEPGCIGGVASGTVKAYADWITFSPNVFAEGEPICRLTDKMFMNNKNTVSLPGLMQEPVKQGCSGGGGGGGGCVFVGVKGVGVVTVLTPIVLIPPVLDELVEKVKPPPNKPPPKEPPAEEPPAEEPPPEEPPPEEPPPLLRVGALGASTESSGSLPLYQVEWVAPDAFSLNVDLVRKYQTLAVQNTGSEENFIVFDPDPLWVDAHTEADNGKQIPGFPPALTGGVSSMI